MIPEYSRSRLDRSGSEPTTARDFQKLGKEHTRITHRRCPTRVVRQIKSSPSFRSSNASTQGLGFVAYCLEARHATVLVSVRQDDV